jgi:hypothetical protein
MKVGSLVRRKASGSAAGVEAIVIELDSPNRISKSTACKIYSFKNGYTQWIFRDSVEVICK